MYEWNYQRQLLAIKLLEHDERAGEKSLAQKEQDIFSERYLLKRPLLEAITCDQSPVLLIDEVDRADEAFEAYLLELLSDFQLSIPELGTVVATSRPMVVGNNEPVTCGAGGGALPVHRLSRFREELAIVRKKAPGWPRNSRSRRRLRAERALHGTAEEDGIAETLDWTARCRGWALR